MAYRIYEGNMERIRKKMTRIQNKCRKYGIDFRFEEVGEEYREIKRNDGEIVTRRFVLVEAEGIARVNGWRFIASVDHTDKENIINKATEEVEVPERYYTSRPFCEHCGTDRWRKMTYIVLNESTGEFKQVGKSCLLDFTGGMSAEGVAQYASAFDDLIEAETPSGGSYEKFYIRTETWMRYVAETIRHYGYVRSDDIRNTRTTAEDFYLFKAHKIREYSDRWYALREEMERIGFDENNPEAVQMAKDAAAWIAEQEESNNYMHNLKVGCSLEYIGYGHMGVVASVFPTWRKDLERKAVAEKEKASEYVGNVGDRITVSVLDYKAVTGWETEWGYTVIYKITDTDGNVYTWKTVAYIPDGCQSITGTVKAHTEYNGTKQTELTRCKCKRGC